MQTVKEVRVAGMTCDGCARRVRSLFMQAPGVLNADVDLNAGRVRVTVSEEFTGTASLAAALEGTKFSISADEDAQQPQTPAAIVGTAEPMRSPPRTVEVRVAGMTCDGCARRVRSLFMQASGVLNADVDLNAGRVRVTVSEEFTGTASLAAALEGTKFSIAKKVAPQRPSSPSESTPLLTQDRFAAAAATSLSAEDRSVAISINNADRAKLETVRLRIGGMTCASCSARVGSALNAVDGVTSADVNLLSNTATVSFDPAAATTRRFVDAVRDAGYTASLVHGTDNKAQREALAHTAQIKSYRWRFLVGLAFSIPLVAMMILEFFQATGDWLHRAVWRGVQVHGLVGFIFATPVQAWLAIPFYVNSARALRHLHAPMDVLVALGTGSSYIFSVVLLVMAAVRPTPGAHAHDQYYFETSVLLLTFVLMGRWLEALAKGRTSRALTKLLELQPATAILLRPRRGGEGEGDGGFEEREIDAALVEKGDLLKVLPGARIPTDGVIEFGVSSADESLLTGESIAVPKQPGDSVIGATINGSGLLRMRATKVGSETFLAQIVSSVETAQASKAPVQAFADKVSSVFVPTVVLISLADFALWFLLAHFHVGHVAEWAADEGSTPFEFAFLFAVTTLVIACPCALGLATPTAVMVGTGIAARSGILIKNADAFERSKGVNAVLLDKTGTLTHGKPTVTDVVVFGDEVAEPEFFRLVATAESSSSHPLASAIVERAKASAPGATFGTVSEMHEIPGAGVDCVVDDGTRVTVGKRSMIPGAASEASDQKLAAFEAAGKTCVCVGINGSFRGIIALADQPRPEAAQVVSELGRMGADVWMITGDNSRTALAVASSVGISERHVLAGVLPTEKALRVRQLQQDGLRVVMVGDGINDSPALAQADVGVAIGAGTDIAIETASMVLVQSDLSTLVRALRIARRTFLRIRQNFAWAFIYNLLAIPIAAGCIHPLIAPHRIPPYAAGLAMSLSSVSVVVSSLLLNVNIARCRQF